jgi:hypothetical protein
MLPENYTGYGVHRTTVDFPHPWYALFRDGKFVDRADRSEGAWSGEAAGLPGCYIPVEGVPPVGRSPKDTPPLGYYSQIPPCDTHRDFIYYFDGTELVAQFMSGEPGRTALIEAESPAGFGCFARTYFGEDPPADFKGGRHPKDPLYNSNPKPIEDTEPMPYTPSTDVVDATYDSIPLGSCYMAAGGDGSVIYQKVNLTVGTDGADEGYRKRALIVSCPSGGRFPIGTLLPVSNTDTRRVVPVASHLQVWR